MTTPTFTVQGLVCFTSFIKVMITQAYRNTIQTYAQVTNSYTHILLDSVRGCCVSHDLIISRGVVPAGASHRELRFSNLGARFII